MLTCRKITEEDKDAVRKGLIDNGIALIGLVDGAVANAFLGDAVKQGGVRVIVALEDRKLAGWNIAVIDSRRYWKRFLLRHPILAVRYFRNKCLGGSSAAMDMASESYAAEIDWPRSADMEWGAVSPNIARHLNISVLDEFRRRGVATALHEALVKELQDNGVTRIDAYIHSGNIPSIALHKKNGWQLVKQELDLLLITLRI